MVNTNKPPIRTIVLLLSVLFVAYDLTRIFNVPITYDEAHTYFYYLSAPFKNITENIPVSANNHILNSLLSKICIDTFGHKLFFLRLPNLLALLAYLCFSYAISAKLFENKFWIVTAFLLLNVHPFLFDFWGLCRGYGLSIALMSGSLYYLISYLNNKRSKDILKTLLLAAAASYSNLALLNFYVALCGILILNMKTAADKNRLQRTGIMAGVTILLYALVWNIVSELRNSNELYFGGKHGLLHDTFLSLLRESLFLSKSSHTVALIYIAYGIAASMIIQGIYWGARIKRDRNIVSQPEFLLYVLLCLVLLSIKLQHAILGTLYIIERTALFIVPLFVLQFSTWLYHLKENKRAAKAIISVLVATALVNFVIHINTRYAWSWKYNMHDRELMERMISRKAPQNAKLKLRLYWQFIPTFKYYAVNYYPQYFQYIENREETPPAGTVYDYYYIHRDETGSVPVNYIQDTSIDGGRFLLYRKPP